MPSTVRGASQNVQDDRAALVLREAQAEWIIKNMPPHAEKVKLECWVWAQPTENNAASTSMVKDWSESEIHRVINAHVKTKGGAQVTKDSPHTLLSLSAPCIPHFLYMLSNAMTFGLVFLGMNGCGKTSVAVTMLLALSRMYSGKVNGQLFQVSDLDQLKGCEGRASDCPRHHDGS